MGIFDPNPKFRWSIPTSSTFECGQKMLNLVSIFFLLIFAQDASCIGYGRRWPFIRLRNRLEPRQNLVPGDACDPLDMWWYPVTDEPDKFAYCHRESKIIVTDLCATVNGIQKLFHESYQQCVMPGTGEHKAPGLPRSSRFGEACVFNTDCLNNMYCPAGTCLCVVGFVDVSSDCYAIINPGQNGCISKRQCDAVWPGSDCEDGVCQCPKPKIAVETRDGFVCITPGSCPLPEDSESPTPPGQLSPSVDTSRPQCIPNAAGTTDKETCYDSDTGQSLADLYDCIPSESSLGIGGICCPNRALTCILPKKTSSSSNTKTMTRYWYNSATGSCEQFLWDPSYAESTANNFRTIDQCRSFCQTSCKRGAPEYSGNTKNVKPKTCSGNNECTRGNPISYQCSAIGNRQFCCAATDWICSQSGGRDYTPSQIPDTGPATSGKTSVIRWYYESSTKSCRSFSYKGEGGNFNNFHTKEECNAFCSQSLCERGDPLKDSNGNSQACTGSRGCPSTYECRQSVCCPRKQTVCVQPKMVGTCASSISKYWYNAATRDCEQFVYTGCNGNDNNFESYLACQNYCRDARPEPKCIQGEADKDSSGNYYTCSLNAVGSSSCRLNYECYFDGYMYGCCPTKAWTCSVNHQTGTACVASAVRWYFDSTSKSCQTFTYAGCDGNSNNFQTRQQCEQYCGVGGCPFGGEPYQDSNTMQRRVCNSQSAPCPSGYECNSVTLSGSPMSYCCPTRAYICAQSPNQGTQCGATLQRYYFNVATKICTTFTYFGCGGNENNFATLSQCNNFCSSAACAPGESVNLDANSQKPITCNIGLQSGCPSGYTCKLDSLTGKNICCGSSDLGLCPAHERAFVEALSQTARECQPGVLGACPSGYLCRENQAKNRYYCCAPDSKAICPIGKTPYRDPLNHQPQTCYLNTVTKSCPAGYVCQSATGGVAQGFCCSTAGICPSNTEFYADSSTGNPRRCIYNSTGTDFSQCPTGYICKLPSGNQPSSTAGYCCKSPPPTPNVVCGIGRKAVVENGLLRNCSTGQQCPEPTVCTLYPGNGQSYCCSQTAIIARGLPNEKSDGCPPGTFVHISDIQCEISNPKSCPAGYSCQFNKASKRYQCCGASEKPKPASTAVISAEISAKKTDGCPNGQIASANTNIQCNVGNTGECPVGFACTYSAVLKKNQCCGLSAGCPDRSVAYIDSITGRPQSCTGENECPTGFACKSASNGNAICCSSDAPIAQLPKPTSQTIVQRPTEMLCPAGNALEDSQRNGSPKLCSESTQCPSGYDCLPSKRGSICCPNRVNVCNLPMSTGGQCPDHAQPSQRYFYNIKNGICQSFTYSGCDGNENNFANIMDCDNFCAKGICPKGEAARSGGLFQFCNTDNACPNGYECKQPMYGPVDKICCPGRDTVCKSAANPGTSCMDMDQVGSVLRFYYDHNANGCKRFDYRGCGGNGNNFFTLEECQAFCAQKNPGFTDPVSSGQTLKCLLPNSKPFIPNGESSPLRCRLGQAGHCPNGYLCQYSGVQSVYICCSGAVNRATTTPVARGFCPQNAQVHANPRTRIPQTCSSYLTCPPQHRCLFSPLRRRGFCCKSSNTTASAMVGKDSEADCPQGLTPYKLAGSRIPVVCPLGVHNSAEPSCPVGYSCAYSQKLHLYVCCGRHTVAQGSTKSDTDADHGCPRGRPFIYPGTRIPLACPGRHSGQCPRGYVCEMSALNGQFQCCSINNIWRWNGHSSENSSAENISVHSMVTTPMSTNAVEQENSGDYVELLPLPEEVMEGVSIRHSMPTPVCDVSKRKFLGEECCADEQCPYGCRTHRRKKICLCQSHLILDMTRKPFRCSPTCWAWRDGGTCIRHPMMEDSGR